MPGDPENRRAGQAGYLGARCLPISYKFASP
jgi:hypothetical protein